jgi:hypothetical protein
VDGARGDMYGEATARRSAPQYLRPESYLYAYRFTLIREINELSDKHVHQYTQIVREEVFLGAGRRE